MRRVLVVDDSKAIRDALQAALEPYGFDLHHAENGAVALQQLRSTAFDLAFVDLNMPVLDGPNLVRLMRAQGIATKVILVTVGAATPVVTSTIKLGASEYVSKPFTPERIRLAVARVLELDPSLLQIRPARVLLQHPDPDVSQGLRALLPAHVELVSAPALTRALELAERTPCELVLLDADVLEGEVGTAALLVRQSLPQAAVFALSRAAAAAAPQSGSPWAPDGALDGVLPVALDEALVRGFLYSNFLRPLVFAEGAVFHAAGFEGSPAYLPAYFAALQRSLVHRLTGQAPTSDPSADLTRLPLELVRIAELIRCVRDLLDELGTAPAFRVDSALVEQLTARPELRRAVIFS
jgi:CheY-like chemotaxis protein